MNWTPEYMRMKRSKGYTSLDNYVEDPELKTEATQSTETRKGLGLEGKDYLGMALQLYGASMADKQADEEAKREDELLQQKQVNDAEAMRMQAQQFERGMQNQERGMNMDALSFLANQRAQALENSRRMSFRSSFGKALMGGR